MTVAKDLGGGAVFFRFLCRSFLILSSLLGTHQYFERLLYGIYQEVCILMSGGWSLNSLSQVLLLVHPYLGPWCLKKTLQYMKSVFYSMNWNGGSINSSGQWLSAVEPTYFGLQRITTCSSAFLLSFCQQVHKRSWKKKCNYPIHYQKLHSLSTNIIYKNIRDTKSVQKPYSWWAVLTCSTTKKD